MDISHILSEDLLAEFEANDPFMEVWLFIILLSYKIRHFILKNFVALLDRTISGFEKCLVPDNFQVGFNLADSHQFNEFSSCWMQYLARHYIDLNAQYLNAVLTD